MKLNTKRLGGRDHHWDATRTKFIIAITMSFVLLQLLFLGNLSYVFGVEYQGNQRVHSLNILVVDYDGGVLGQSLQAAYQELRADSFPTLDERSTTEYPSESSIKKAVCSGAYWAAVYVHSDATARLTAAISGQSTAYNSSDTISYIWNEARYPTLQEGIIVSSLEELFAATTGAYHSLSGADVFSQLDVSSQTARSAFFEPITASSINIMPTSQGPRVFYNTIGIVMPIIQQFFFLMALNGVSGSFGLLERLTIKGNGFLRGILAFCYTFIAAITASGYIWAFREGWNVTGGQYILTVLALWLYMHVNFLVLDVATAFIPMSFLPFFVLTWAITNVTSTITPFELSAGWYRVGYALPAHQVWQILVQVWSGCPNRLYQTLPILFAYEVAGLAGAVAANYYRCNKAAIAAVAIQNTTQNPDEKVTQAGSVADAESAADSSLYIKANERVLGPSVPQPFMDTLLRRSGTI